MFYVIDVETAILNNLYYIFETNTESTIKCSGEVLKQLISSKAIEVKNVNLSENTLEIKTYANEIHNQLLFGSNSGAEYIVLCLASKNKYKIVKYDGKVEYINTEKLFDYFKQEKIYNYVMQNNKPVLMDRYKVTDNQQFKESIAEKYKKYTALTAMLGSKSTFNYEVEGDVVRLAEYTGESRDMIIPNFITAIKQRAFISKWMQSVTIGNSVEYIGSNAFKGCNISEITIPEQVKFIGGSAFSGNKKLVGIRNDYKETIKILGKSTITFKEYFTE